MTSASSASPAKFAPGLEQELAAILAADIVGYSKHTERDGVKTLAALPKLRELSDAIIAIFAGKITSTAGDNVIAEFSSILSAVKAAMNIDEQSYVRNRNAGNTDIRFGYALA